MSTVRLATLADTSAIVDIHRSHNPLAFDEMSLYERWQEGGPWMSVETCAVHLNRLLAGSGVPLVAEDDGRVLAEAEIYESYEPAPFGHHLHIGLIVSHADHPLEDVGPALVKYIVEMARLMKCERVTASIDGAPQSLAEFYSGQGFRQTRTGHGINIAAQQGRAFYQATDLVDRNPEQIKGWYMPLGRYQSSRQEWEKLFPQDWAAGIPEILNIQTTHIKLTVTGQNAIIFMREADQPGVVSLSCWSARPLSNPLLTAIRDRAFRDGYQTLSSYVLDGDLPASDVQANDYIQHFYELPI